MPTTLEKLSALQNYRTRYEIVAECGNKRLLIGYSPRVSRCGLLAAMQNVGPAIIQHLAIGDGDTISWHTKPRIHCLTSGWLIGFTGRTQRDAILAGELPFIGANAMETEC